MPSASAGHNLPSVPSSFVGRMRETAELRGLLEQHRLVTVVGTGGVGKTRLAIRTAVELEGLYPGGAWMADLSAVSDPSLVAKTVATAVGIREQPGRTLEESLVDLLRQRQLLLVLDNCEHVARASAEIAGTLLRACPGVKILATSRAALRVAGEVAWPLRPLDTPSDDAIAERRELADSEAVRLFIERASQATPHVPWTTLDLEPMARIVRRLDGLPLAIELAAARTRSLTPEEILERLHDGLSLLTRGESTAQPRHQTLLATLDWSSALLAPSERVLLRRLGVFAAGMELPAVESVAAFEPIERREILDLMAQLVETSMLAVEHLTSGVARYRLLETVREYALREAESAGELTLLRDRHLEWCMRLVEEAEPHLYRQEQVDWMARLEREHSNIRAALDHSRNSSDAGLHVGRMASALGWFWYLHGHLIEGRRWLETALSLAATAPHYAHSAALRWTGIMAYGRGEIESAVTWFERSVRAARLAGDKRALAHALSFLCFALRDRGRYAEATAAGEESLVQATESGFEWGIAFGLYQVGVMSFFGARHQWAWDSFDESLRRFRELGDRLGTAYCLHALSERETERNRALAVSMNVEALHLSEELGNRRGVCFSLQNLALITMQGGDDEAAIEYHRRALKLWRELGSTHQAAVALVGLATLLATRQNKAAAVRILGASEALIERTGGVLRADVRETFGYERTVAAARVSLGRKLFEHHWHAGRLLDLDAAVEFALGATFGAATSQGASEDPLSSREREVAVMVGRGLTNQTIAHELGISKQTVDRHVGNILNKLGFERRAQVATWVAERRTGTPTPK